MLYPKPLAIAGISLAAAAPLILHGHVSADCNPRITLCAVSEALYLPDDPAPKPAPQFIFAPRWLAQQFLCRRVRLCVTGGPDPRVQIGLLAATARWGQTLEPPPPKIAAHPRTKPRSYHPPEFGNE